MKLLARWKIGILAGIILVIALTVWNYSSNANSLTALHQDELLPALGKYYYQQYVQYKQEFPKFTGSFSGEVNTFQVLSYQSECSIIKARYTYIGVSAGTNYFLLKNNGSGWEVTDWAPAVDSTTADWVNKTLPIPFTCAGE